MQHREHCALATLHRIQFVGGELCGMERIESAYNEGVTAAERDIATGKPKLRYGVRGAWGEDLARTLQTQFGVELIVLSCFTDAASRSFESGYNATVEAHIDDLYGLGSIGAVWDEIRHSTTITPTQNTSVVPQMAANSFHDSIRPRIERYTRR
jgi:hypothetical protein